MDGDLNGIGMIRPNDAFEPRQGALIKGLGLGVPALGSIQIGQIAHARQREGMILAKRKLGSHHRSLSGRDGLGVFPLLIKLNDPAVERLDVLLALRPGPAGPAKTKSIAIISAWAAASPIRTICLSRKALNDYFFL